MTELSTSKTSSRAGRFKKKLVTEEELALEAPAMQVKLAPFLDLYRSGQLTQADFAACYIILFLSHRYPGKWLGASSGDRKRNGVLLRDLPFRFERNIESRLSDFSSLYDVFENFALKSTPLSVNRAVLAWSGNKYGLELMFRIPSPREVLDQQKRGRRCATAVLDHRLSRYILGERDALGFLMHDLIHADHFYHNNTCYQGQLAFYNLLDQTFTYFDLSNEKFAAEFEYLIADMNAYAVHLLKCLKSAMVHYFSEDYYRGWLSSINAPLELYALNTPNYFPEKMDEILLTWMTQFIPLPTLEVQN